MNWSDLGLCPYEQALDLQRRLVAEQKNGTGTDTLLLLEHPPIVTLGRRANEANILASPEALARQGIAVYKVDRGGDVTYHGPGQLVGYPIIDLRHFRRDIRWYVGSLAQALIRTLAEFGIDSAYRPEYPGVWVGDEKIAAIGAHISSWITSHGFAMNVDPNMQHRELIIPCGLHDKGVTSLSRLLGRPVSVAEVMPNVVKNFGAVFEVEMVSGVLDQPAPV